MIVRRFFTYGPGLLMSRVFRAGVLSGVRLSLFNLCRLTVIYTYTTSSNALTTIRNQMPSASCVQLMRLW
jgi:hypothetical protein